MTIQVHGIGGSAPCRIVYMTCEALGLDYETVTCDLQKGDNRTPEYLKVIAQSSNNVKTKFLISGVHPIYYIHMMRKASLLDND